MRRSASRPVASFSGIRSRHPASIAFVHEAMAARKALKALIAEVTIRPEVEARGLNGSGLLIINPPWTLHGELEALLPFLAERLAQRPGGGYACCGRWQVEQASRAAKPPLEMLLPCRSVGHPGRLLAGRAPGRGSRSGNRSAGRSRPWTDGPWRCEPRPLSWHSRRRRKAKGGEAGGKRHDHHMVFMVEPFLD